MKRNLLLILVALLPVVANAYDAKIDGIYYNFSGNEAIVTYGKSSDYSGDVVIPESVTYNGKTYSVISIGESAFNSCRGLTSVTIPSSVTSIGYDAFGYCRSLTSITIPNSVTTIGDCAFRECRSLTSITIPNSVKSIGPYTFLCCTSLISITIPNNVISIGKGAFQECTSLTSVTISNSVTSIGEHALSYCSNLIEVYCYAKDVPTSNSNSFSNSNIESATLFVPSSSIEAYSKTEPWSKFGKIESITIDFADANVKAICIANWDTDGDGELSKIEAAAVTSLGNVFQNQPITSFNELQYFTNLTTISQNAFSGCYPWASVTIPENVTTIGNGAFEGSSLTSIIIPNGVTSIGDYVFQGCPNLTSVTIGYGVTSIGFRAFFGCTGLTSVTIGNNVTSIGVQAFAFCRSLTSITIPESVTSIDERTFRDCI